MVEMFLLFSEFIQIDLLFFTTRFVLLCAEFGSLQPVQSEHAWNPSSLWGK